MTRLSLMVVAGLFALVGCGYHAPGPGDSWVGREGRTLYVDLFVNRTVEPYLDSVVTDEIAMQLSRVRLVALSEQRPAADLLLTGTVASFESRAVAYSDDDRISEYAATMQLHARLVRRSDGAVLWQDDLQRTETYPATVDKNLRQEGESLGARVLARRLAEDLVSRLLATF